MLYSVFLYGIISWMFKNIPVRNGGGVRSTYAMKGVVVSVHVRTMGGEGSNFGHFVCVRTNRMTPFCIQYFLQICFVSDVLTGTKHF